MRVSPTFQKNAVLILIAMSGMFLSLLTQQEYGFYLFLVLTPVLLKQNMLIIQGLYVVTLVYLKSTNEFVAFFEQIVFDSLLWFAGSITGIYLLLKAKK